jgi:hypothetical protein
VLSTSDLRVAAANYLQFVHPPRLKYPVARSINPTHCAGRAFQNLKCAGVSAVTGEGMEAFFEAAQAMAEQYNVDYLPELERRKAEKLRQDAARKEVRTARQKLLRILILGISGGGLLTRPLRDARRFPFTRWYPVPGTTRTTSGFGICPSFKDHSLSRRAQP